MRNKIVATLALSFGMFSSCNERVLDKVNPNQLGTETFYRTGPQIVSAVNSVYAGLQGTNMYTREYFFLHDLLSDDVQSGGPQLENPRAQVLNYVFDPANNLIRDVWQGLYRVVHRANLVIENAPKANLEVTDELKNRVIGEAKFLRAWAYFDLVSMWGRVPLMTKSVNTPESQPRAASEEEIYSLILADLAEAEAALPLKSEYSGSDLGRATRGAAQALSARVHLFRGDYAKAREQLLKVINSGQYQLISNFRENFLEENENNAESIFEVQFSSTLGDGGAWNGDGSGIAEVTFRGQEYGPNAWRNLIPNDRLVAEYEKTAKGDPKDDPRYADTFYSIGDKYGEGQAKTLTATDVQGDITKPSWKKYQMIYKANSEQSRSGINFRVIRHADVLLMMAEVENELSGPAAALPYINQVRARPSVAMSPLPTANFPTDTKEQMFRAIVHERRVELAGEQIRNRDIRRWRKNNKLGAEPIINFQANKHELLPIPQNELDNNKALSNGDQNPGY